MNTQAATRNSTRQARRRWRCLCLLAYVLGLGLFLVVVRLLPPAPAFSEKLGRATYLQSYESSYFASLRSYEKSVKDALRDGSIPVVVFGDSTIRGTGAAGEDVWTRILERRLRTIEPRVRVMNFAQNAGDLMGPHLYHYLRKRYPEAYYIVEASLGSEVNVRHPFHFWLTSEIRLRDGDANPASRHSFQIFPAGRTSEAEGSSFVLAALNIATNYVDLGNWVRYACLGRVTRNVARNVVVKPLWSADESDSNIPKFVPPTEDSQAMMRSIFTTMIDTWAKYIRKPLPEREAYMDDMYPLAARSRLLLLSVDWNPYYAPKQDAVRMQQWKDAWQRIPGEMAGMKGLLWTSLSSARGELETDDFLDLGHLTVGGQRKLADKVADTLLGPQGWFGANGGTRP